MSIKFPKIPNTNDRKDVPLNQFHQELVEYLNPLIQERRRLIEELETLKIDDPSNIDLISSIETEISEVSDQIREELKYIKAKKPDGWEKAKSEVKEKRNEDKEMLSSVLNCILTKGFNSCINEFNSLDPRYHLQLSLRLIQTNSNLLLENFYRFTGIQDKESQIKIIKNLINQGYTSQIAFAYRLFDKVDRDEILSLVTSKDKNDEEFNFIFNLKLPMLIYRTLGSIDAERNILINNIEKYIDENYLFETAKVLIDRGWFFKKTDFMNKLIAVLSAEEQMQLFEITIDRHRTPEIMFYLESFSKLTDKKSQIKIARLLYYNIGVTELLDNIERLPSLSKVDLIIEIILDNKFNNYNLLNSLENILSKINDREDQLQIALALIQGNHDSYVIGKFNIFDKIQDSESINRLLNLVIDKIGIESLKRCIPLIYVLDREHTVGLASRLVQEGGVDSIIKNYRIYLMGGKTHNKDTQLQIARAFVENGQSEWLARYFILFDKLSKQEIFELIESMGQSNPELDRLMGLSQVDLFLESFHKVVSVVDQKIFLDEYFPKILSETNDKDSQIQIILRLIETGYREYIYNKYHLFHKIQDSESKAIILIEVVKNFDENILKEFPKFIEDTEVILSIIQLGEGIIIINNSEIFLKGGKNHNKETQLQIAKAFVENGQSELLIYSYFLFDKLHKQEIFELIESIGQPNPEIERLTGLSLVDLIIDITKNNNLPTGKYDFLINNLPEILSEINKREGQLQIALAMIQVGLEYYVRNEFNLFDKIQDSKSVYTILQEIAHKVNIDVFFYDFSLFIRLLDREEMVRLATYLIQTGNTAVFITNFEMFLRGEKTHNKETQLQIAKAFIENGQSELLAYSYYLFDHVDKQEIFELIESMGESNAEIERLMGLSPEDLFIEGILVEKIVPNYSEFFMNTFSRIINESNDNEFKLRLATALSRKGFRDYVIRYLPEFYPLDLDNPYENHPHKYTDNQMLITNELAEIMEGNPDSESLSRLGINEEEITPIVLRAEEILQESVQVFYERVRNSSHFNDNDKVALLTPEQSPVYMTPFISKLRSLVARYLVQSVSGDMSKISDLENTLANLRQVIDMGFDEYYKVYEFHIHLHDKLFEELDRIKSTGRSIVEVYLGRDGIYSYFGRRSQDLARNLARSRGSARSRNKINRRYLVFPRPFTGDGGHEIPKELVIEYLSQQGINEGDDLIFTDTGYSGSIPLHIAKKLVVPDINSRIKLLSTHIEEYKLSGITYTEDERITIVNQIEHAPKVEESSEYIIRSRETGRLVNVAKPTSPEEQFQFLLTKVAIERHYFLDETLKCQS